MRNALLLVLLLTFGVPGVAGDDRDDRIRELNDLSKRLNRYATDGVNTEERTFLHERVVELLARMRTSIDQEYVFGRLAGAVDDLLDASDQIEEAVTGESRSSDTRIRAAHELEDTYFDLKQGEYFARQSGDQYASAYVKVGRRLYQKARAAYEEEQFAAARDLGEAAREVVAGLENLAQAAVRIPTPPKL